MPAAPQTPRLGDWLLDQGHLTPTQLDLALREQRRRGKLLGEALRELGFVSQEVLAQFLAEKTRTETVNVRSLKVDPALLELVPEALARRLVALPVSRDGDTLTIAISDPLNVTAFDVLEQTTRLRVNLAAAPEGELIQAIEQNYQTGQSVEQLVDELLKLGDERLATTTEKDAPMIRLVDRIIAQAVLDQASDIHVHPEERVVRIRLRRDGVLSTGYLLPKSIQAALIARFKLVGGMDIAESRRSQGGRANVTVGGRDVGLRFSTLPTSFGESVVVRVLDRGSFKLSLSSLGFAPDLEKRFRSLLDRPHGVILVTGPTGSGKTTTLYTALSLLDSAENSIFTLEDPVEYQLPLVRQTQINESIGLTFAEGLRTLLRQDPDVILVGETRDTETAQLMVRAALTGHLVFSTLHTNDALGAIPRLVDLGVESYLLAPTLVGVLAQRLVRQLCPECREPSDENLDTLAALRIPVVPGRNPKLYRAVGCPRCNNTGFKGRIGIHELLVIDDSFRSSIARGVEVDRLQELARSSGFRTLFEDGIEKALLGLTTVEEILRVTRQ